MAAANLTEEKHDADGRQCAPIDAETSHGKRLLQMKSSAFIGGYPRPSASGF
jgi:hypothetical protein